VIVGVLFVERFGLFFLALILERIILCGLDEISMSLTWIDIDISH
jgi:hypothetical protein